MLVTTLTKRMAEDLTEYYHELGVRVRYLHSDIETLERVEILRDLRKGEFDVLVGINLLREGLDLPEVSLVAILDADKEGFLRSAGSLIQTIGRAARNVAGQGHPLRRPDDRLDEARRSTRRTGAARCRSSTTRSTASRRRASARTSGSCSRRSTSTTTWRCPRWRRSRRRATARVDEIEAEVKALEKQMREAAKALEFEKAAEIRDRIRKLRAREFGLK